ncbi:DUF4864 domain-containing protein [Undibacterium arcticum]|uniref:DUF4864 domain-containing protein n=2 Tax=Undibacterium arcticum TaxID=1762892 RepID=A0ABV7EWH0_9BURK
MRRRSFLMAGLVWVPMLALAPVSASVSELSAADTRAIREVVQSQFDAFEDDDAPAAFALTTQASRRRLGSPDDFMRLVKEQYGPIYRHRAVLFSGAQVIGADTLLIVRLTSPDSHVWIAIYRMERETDGKWKIDGCHLLETTSVSI